MGKIINIGSNEGIEILHVKVLNCDVIENIISVYCPPSAHTCLQDWQNLFSLFSKRTIIMGDFNGHHTNWSRKVDNRGSQIFDALLDSSFVSLNDCSPTRIKLSNGILQQLSPDITLASTDIALKFNWSVTNETLGSDHRIIVLSSFLEKCKTTILKRNFKKADWASYTCFLDNLFSSNFFVQNNLQSAYDLFVDNLNLAADIHIPYIKINENPCSNFVPKSYWSSDLSKIVAERRIALANL